LPTTEPFKAAHGTFVALLRRWRIDLLSAVLLAAAAGLFANYLYGMHSEVLIQGGGGDIWFQGDTERVYGVMTDRGSDKHYRTKVHPLHSVVVFPPSLLLDRVVSQEAAVRIVTVAIAMFWTLALYATLRLVGCALLDTNIFTLLGVCSGAFIFWASVPETYTLGSATILAALALAAVADQKPRDSWLYVVTSAATLAFTTTNWMVGLLTTWTGNAWRNTVALSLMAFGLVSLLWGIQKYFFRYAVYFLGDKEETLYVFKPDLSRLFEVLGAVLSSTMVVPAIEVVGNNSFGRPILGVQAALPGSGSVWGVVAVLLWAVLLACGVAAMLALKEQRGLRVVIALSLLGQVGLHLVYGAETFLYAMHFLPLVLVMVALAMRTRLRPVSIVAATLLLPMLLLGNLQQVRMAGNMAKAPPSTVQPLPPDRAR
jgi:hypothetical protein